MSQNNNKSIKKGQHVYVLSFFKKGLKSVNFIQKTGVFLKNVNLFIHN